MKFAHKSGIDLIKLYIYICSANSPNTMFWISSMASLGLPLINVWIYLTKMCIYILITCRETIDQYYRAAFLH